MSTGALERLASRAPSAPARAGPHCDLCGLALPEQHRHLLDEERDEPLCTCRACSLLFEREAAGRGHFRLIPDTRLRLAGLPTEGLGVPVGLVYLVRSGDGAVVAHYPSPIGSTQHEIDPPAWAALERCAPELAAMAPRVQALLVNTARGASEHWLVPIDDCYRLVALIRQEWQGLSGGSRVWPAIERFFAGLVETRRPARREEQ
jgi:Family of unknown function (DUF5947)